MKTVYVLGAGFSYEAGKPIQAELIKKAFEIYKDNPNIFNKDKFKCFRDFLSNQLNVSEEDFSDTELEDIFTPLDRCLGDRTQYRGVSLEEITKTRESVFYVIGKTIGFASNEDDDKSEGYIHDFSKYITNISSARGGQNYRGKDPVSVISTNWDTLLDYAIKKSIKEREDDKAVVDYCCYISSLDKDDDTIKPGLEILGEGGFNVKLLKLHGSLNWLQCPRCSRMYADFSNKIGRGEYITIESCRHCDKNFPEEKDNHILAFNLIMPTFLKDLSNPQYKIIWQNAGIEISEAEKIVFIGYSLPSADFDMRQLLSRMVRKSAKIHVVDYCLDESKWNEKEKHWRRFFGKRTISFEFKGAKKYVTDLVKDSKE